MTPIDGRRPHWWPEQGAGALLDLRDGQCRLICWDPRTGMSRFSEPAYIRLNWQDRPVAWGHSAAAWKERAAAGRVRAVFPEGWPSDTATARWYLNRLAEMYLEPRQRCRLRIVEHTERRWARRLWHESLEDSSFAVVGFCPRWQYDLLLSAWDRPERALEDTLHLELEEAVLSWSFLRAGERIAGGRDAKLSRNRLFHLLGEYARRHLGVEASAQAIAQLLRGSLAEDSLPPASEAHLAGRHLASGLPIRQPFDWLHFLHRQADLASAWRSIKKRMVAQALGLGGTEGSRAAGLELAGWRMLPGGELSALFVEGELVLRLERGR